MKEEASTFYQGICSNGSNVGGWNLENISAQPQFNKKEFKGCNIQIACGGPEMCMIKNVG
jgi:hypothetical protein